MTKITGDTLHHLGFQLPTSVSRKIRWFLNGTFGDDFAWAGCSLSHGRQDDFRQCGVGAANMIAAEVLGEELFMHERLVHHRVTWFLRLAKADQALVRMSDHPRGRWAAALTTLTFRGTPPRQAHLKLSRASRA